MSGYVTKCGELTLVWVKYSYTWNNFYIYQVIVATFNVFYLDGE